VLIPAEDYEQIRPKLESVRTMRETAAVYEILKSNPAKINEENGTATIPIDLYNNLIASREARFAVIREMQKNAPDLPEEQEQQIVEKAMRRVGQRMQRAVIDINVIVSSVISKKEAPYLLLDAWYQSRFMLITSEEIVHEVQRVLSEPDIKGTFFINDSEIENLIGTLWENATLAAGTAEVRNVTVVSPK
jgi:putative PIN family toxin of toxin-antitoxin system